MEEKREVAVTGLLRAGCRLVQRWGRPAASSAIRAAAPVQTPTLFFSSVGFVSEEGRDRDEVGYMCTCFMSEAIGLRMGCADVLEGGTPTRTPGPSMHSGARARGTLPRQSYQSPSGCVRCGHSRQGRRRRWTSTARTCRTRVARRPASSCCAIRRVHQPRLCPR